MNAEHLRLCASAEWAELGTDGADTPSRRALHVDDVFTPVDPAGLPGRLRAAGFAEVLVDGDGDRFRFRARR